MSQAPNVTVQQAPPKYLVDTLTGHELELMTAREADFYTSARTKYTTENTFTAGSDHRALDRLIFFETQMFRWQTQLASGMNYDGDYLTASEESALRRSVKETAPLISQIQVDLGLTKSQREKEKHESVGSYIQQLQIAAKEHGINREKQLGRAIELCKELFALAGAYQRSNENERKKLGFESPQDIVDWVLDVMKPQFDEVDEYFRKHQQRFWLRKL